MKGGLNFVMIYVRVKEILKEKEIAKDEELEIIEKAVEIAFEALE